jgi:hypothetical protein
MSFKPEVIADTSGKWCGNALRFATCVVESDDPANYRYVDARLESLTIEAAPPVR